MKNRNNLFTATLVALACFAFSPQMQALSPPPDGGYPNFTTAAGDHALQALTLGVGNTAIGTLSLFSVTTGTFNTAVGAGSLYLNTGDYNTATGVAALLFNTTGNNNTASGFKALFSNTTGHENTANGLQALLNNTTGSNNTANGRDALLNNTTGSNNTATGFQALFNNNGDGNTANGFDALTANITGFNNTANGFLALTANTTGNTNTAIGTGALLNNTTGSSNKALGFNAGTNVTTATNVIAIGSAGANVSNSCFIGNIRGVTTQNADAVPVLIDSAGQLGTASSSARFKKDVNPMDKTSEALLALKPVTFHYKTDKTSTPQFGLIAEQVAEVNPNLVVRDKDGEIYTVRYDAVNAMLLNEFLKEHSKVEQMQKQIDALTAVVQKVSAQLELSKAAPQTVNNP